MHDLVPIVAIVFGSLVTIFFITTWAVVRLITGGRRRHGREEREESQMIQELYQGLLRMEKRVETLETLLIERERQRGERRE
jgi:phage shock protein B